jgi:hypothetical protein
MIDIFCCFKKKIYNKIENNNDNIKKIHILLKNRNYLAISNEDLYDIYVFIYKTMTIDDFISYKIRDIFIINLYESIYLKYVTIKGKNLKYVNRIFSKLITLYLFYSSNNLIISTNFLINNNHLFDINLWLSLFLDPKNKNDEHYLFISLFLIKNNIINPNLQIIFYNLNYNLIEYLIIGKITFDKNNIIMVRFIDIDLITKFIKELISLNKLFINDYFFDVINQIYTFDNIDVTFIENIISLIKKN